MTTTIDIPPALLKEAMQRSNARDEREAVVQALEEFVRRRRQAELIPYLGTFRDFITQQELAESREQRTMHHGVD